MKQFCCTVIDLMLIASVLISCSDKKRNHPDIIIHKFNKASYYEKTGEVRDELYQVIDSRISSDDRAVICSALQSYSIDNLSADVVIEVREHQADTVRLFGLLTFDREQNPGKITDSTVLAVVTKAILAPTKYSEEDGSYPARIQLEKFCD